MAWHATHGFETPMKAPSHEPEAARHGPAVFSRLGMLGVVVSSLAACAPMIQEAGTSLQMPELGTHAVVAADSVRLPLKTWSPEDLAPRAVIVALHGFNDYSNAFEAAAAEWARRGITTYAYDQRGFGGTEPRGIWASQATLVRDLCTVIELVRVRHPGLPVHVLGESMGSAIALIAMAKGDAPEVDGLILSAPAMQSWTEHGLLSRGFLWMMAHTMPWWSASGRGLDIVASDNIEMLRALADDPLVIHQTRIDALYGLIELMDSASAAAPAVDLPVLILHGAKDELISESAARELATLLPAPPTLVIYPQGYHMLFRDLQADTVIEDVAAWILDPSAAVPSGFTLSTEVEP